MSNTRSPGRPDYVTIKNWKKWQHYKDREPPWVKIHSRLLADDGFMGLSEADQWQLVRIWLVAARSSKYALDGDKRRTPVLSCKEATIRRAIGSTKRVPLDRFIAEGWLIPVDSAAVESYTQGGGMLDDDTHGDSTTQAPLASTLLELEETEELNTTAAAGVQRTSSTTEANYAETEHLQEPAAAQVAATEPAIHDACKRFGAEPNIAEPWARQLTAGDLETIVAKMESKIRRGTVERVPAQFVDLMQRQVKANVKKRAAVTIHIPTLEETVHADVAQYARGGTPWDVAADLLTRKMRKLDVPAEQRDQLLDELHAIYDDQADAA